MAEGLPQLDSSPGALRRNLPPLEDARASSVQSREASSISPLRDFSPLHSSAPSRGSSDGIHPAPSLELVELKITAESVEELLKSQLVILSGGRDKEGQSILTVPAKPKDFHFTKADLLRVIQYLTSLPRDEIRECGYSLIIDGRSATWSTIKSLLHMFQECLPGQIHVAYIISPSHFLEKKRASMRMGKEKERLEFTTTVVPTIDRLGHHMDMNQVTADLGGLLPYNHKEWMKMRMDLEHFIASYNALLQRFSVFERELCSDMLAEDSEGAEKMIGHHASLLQEIRGAPKSVQKEGNDILVVIEQNQDNFGQSCMTPEKINTMAVVRSLLERVNKRAQMLEDQWRARKHQLDQTLQLRVFENAIGKINGWLKVKSPEILGGKQEIGDSVPSSEEALRSFQRTEAKSKGVQDNMTKLRMMSDRMCGANHFASEDLNHHIAKLNSRWVRHNELMGLRKRILEGATNFHQLQEKFIEVCDGLAKQLQSPLPMISQSEDVAQLLSHLEEMQSAASKVMEEVCSGAQSLLGQMQRAVSVTQGGQLAPDYSKGMHHVEAVKTELKERLTTVGHLVEARRTALGQCRQVFRCEQDVVKVIAWLQHLASQMTSTRGDLGESLEAVQHLQLDHRKFVETAKKTFLGGQDLLSTALKNREKYSLDLLPNQDLQKELSAIWEGIDSAITERERRLETAERFHRETEELLQELERLNHPTANLPDTKAEVEQAVEELGHHGDDLKKKTQDAIVLGESLLLSMSQPLFSGQAAKETNEQASLCAQLIRGRIDHLKAVSLDFHRMLQTRRKCLKDAILLRSVEADVHMVQAWYKGEGQLQPCVVLSKGMAMSELKKVEQEHTRTMENKWKAVEQLKTTAESLTDCNHFSPQIVAMATELLAVWSEYLSESDTLSSLCRSYVTFWDSCKQLDGLVTEFSKHSGEADLRWEEATPELLRELQKTKNQLADRAQQVVTEGHKVAEKLGEFPGCSSLIHDVEGQIQEIKRRMDQMHAYWLKVESTMSNTLQLRKHKEEACSLLIEMNDMAVKLGRVDFGSSSDDFEVKEQEFAVTTEECTARLHRCDEVKSLIQRLVLLGVAGDSEGACEKIVVEMGSLRSTLQMSLDSVRRGFEGADDVTRKCAKLCQKIALLDQLSPTASKADYIKELTTCQEDVVTTYRNWLQLVKPFAVGGKLSGEVEEACQIAGEVISGYHRQVEDMRKVRQVEQEADKDIEWLDSRVRQFLVANAELGEHGEMARELKNKLTHFLQSVQPSLKGIAHLNSLCQSLVDSGSSFADLIRPYHSRLRVCQEVCEKALKERLDICTTFVDFEDAAEEELRYIRQVEGYCEEIPAIMEDPQRGGDILQSGGAAVNKMAALVAVLEKNVSAFAQLAFSDMSVEMAPPLHVDGALSRITQELGVLRKKVESVILNWKQGEAELQCLLEYHDFWSSHKEITSWLQLQGLPYLSMDIGSRLSEAEDLILEQQEFQSKVKKIEREVEAAVALGNSATAKNPIPEVRMAMSDLTSYFNWFKQLVELRGMALGRAVEFFKKAKEISRSLASLTDESQDSEKEKVAKEIIQIRTMAEDIAATVTQLQSEDCPVIGEHLLNVVDSLEDQLAGNDTHRALCLESPPSVTPEHQASLAPVSKPNLPRRRDSKRRYLRYSASVRRSSTASQDGVEDVDAGKKTKFRGVTMVTKELCESEEEYVCCLSLLVDHYLKELDHSPHRPDFIVERKGEVFGNTEEVYAVHKKLLQQLRQAKGTEQICKCFLQMEMQFRVYINYLKIVSHGWKTLTLFGGTFFDDVKRSKRLDFPMLDCYNRTFNRLEQYCRMFKDLLVATHKEDLHSVRVVQQTCVMLTQTLKLCTNLVAFGNLRGSPTPLPEEGLLLVDDFIVVTVRNKRKRPNQILTVFLHEDCFVLAKQELKDPIHPPIFHFQDQLLCAEMMLTENYKSKDSKVKFAVSSGPIATAETVHILQPAFKEGEEELKDKWIKTINELLMRQLETMKALKGRGRQDPLPPPIVHHVDIRKDKRKAKETRESKLPSTVMEGKRGSGHVTIEKIAPADMKSSIKVAAESDIYIVYKKYHPRSNEELPLSVGQLVEVLDRSGDSWLVCTTGEGDSEPMEGFVPAKALRKYEPDESGRPLSMVSQYSFVSQLSDDRSSLYSQGPPPGPLPEALSQSSGSRPTSMVVVEKRSPRPTPEDLPRPVSLPPAPGAISGPHQPSIVAEDITWYCIEDYRDYEAGFSLSVGEAVEVLDTSGPQWYVVTIKDPREGFVPPHVLSQFPPAHSLHNQPSVVEDRTPTLSQPPIWGQVSVVEAQTPTTQPQGKELGGTLTPGDLQETVVTALLDRQLQESMGTSAERVKTPTEQVTTPTEPAKSPTELVKTPTERVKTPTELVKTPTEQVTTPTEPAKSPTELVKTPTEPVKTQIESTMTPTEPKDATAQVLLASDDSPPSHHTPPPANQPRPHVGGDFLNELTMQLERKKTDAPPAVTVIIPPPMLTPSAQSSLESQKSSGLFYTALANFEGSPEEHSVSLQEGQLVQVVDRSQTAWWLVVPLTPSGEELQEGWVPANFLQAVEDPPPSDHGSSLGTPAAGGDQTPDAIGDQTPGLLIATDPFDTVVTEIEPPLAAQPEVTEVKPRLYTSIAHVMARHPNELSLQLAETVELVDDGRSDWWLVRTLTTATVASTEGWVPSAALTLLMQEEPEPPKEPPKEDAIPVEDCGTHVVLADFTATEGSHLSVVKNQVVKVMNDSRDDWTLVQAVNGEGWVPKSYLRALDVHDGEANPSW